jgi:hypothetical protein
VLFKIALGYIQQGLHLTREGLIKIISIKASMNRGLSLILRAAFPEIISVARPLVKNPLIPDPQ